MIYGNDKYEMIDMNDKGYVMYHARNTTNV